MGQGPTWIPEEEKVLAYFFNRGKDDVYIGEVLGRSENAIAAKRKDMGLLRRVHKPSVKPPATKVVPQSNYSGPDLETICTKMEAQLLIMTNILSDIHTEVRESRKLFEELSSKKPQQAKVQNGEAPKDSA